MCTLNKSSMTIAVFTLLFSFNAAAANEQDAADQIQKNNAINVTNMEGEVVISDQHRDTDVTLPLIGSAGRSASNVLVSLVAADNNGSATLGPETSYDLVGNDC